MSEMVDRVARVIADKENVLTPFELHYRLARKIIAAMRDPTDSMLRTGYAHIVAEKAWRAMIDEALK